MAIAVKCQGCGYSFAVKDEMSGKRGKCPKCAAIFQVAAAGAPTQPAAPARPAAARPAAPKPAAQPAAAKAAPARPAAARPATAVRPATPAKPQPAPARPAMARPAARPAKAESDELEYAPAPKRPAKKSGFEVPVWAWFVVGGVALFSALGATVFIAYKKQQMTSVPDKPKHLGQPLRAEGFAPPPVEKVDLSNRPKKGTSTPEVVKYVRFGIVAIEAYDEYNNRRGLGSGFVLDPSGLVVTNYHVVEDCVKADALFDDGTRYGVEGYMGLEPDSDLAILKLNGTPPNMVTLDLAFEPTPEIGEDVIAIGHPNGHKFKTTFGKISDVGVASNFPQEEQMWLKTAYHDEGKNTWIVHTAQILHGNSGGPLLNDVGAVVGVNTWIFPDPSTGAIRTQSAISSKHIAALKGHLFSTPDELKKHQRPPPTLADMIGSDVEITAENIEALAKALAAKNWLPESGKEFDALDNLMLAVTFSHMARREEKKKSEGGDGEKKDEEKKEEKKSSWLGQRDLLPLRRGAALQTVSTAPRLAALACGPQVAEEAEKDAAEQDEAEKDDAQKDESKEEKSEGNPGGLPDAAALAAADKVVEQLKAVTWDPEKHLPALNKWSALQANERFAGMLLFGMVVKVFTGGEGRNGVLVHIEKTETDIFIVLDDMKGAYKKGDKLLVAGVAVGGTLWYGDNPLEQKPAKIVFSDVLIPTSFSVDGK